ncbi:MAG: T9SS type A sorting domain-containing protein [Bacteroidales bacterium]|nr:T9SS type A sorting domain-containing protein [Bacteroidales bacterium]MCF8337989.1 T9SS type A sorting domain-containing protein [Bacteroidales bacterium]
MKKQIFILSLLLTVYFSANAKFIIDRTSVYLGSYVMLDYNYDFTITVQNFKDDDGFENEFDVEVDYGDEIPWIDQVTPDNFTITEYGGKQEISFSGAFDADPKGYYEIYVNITSSEETKKVLVYGTVEPGVASGYNYIDVTSATTEFSESETLNYNATFYDQGQYEENEYAVEWTLKLQLFTPDGEYTYYEEVWPWGQWEFSAPSVPDGYDFLWNNQGQIKGRYLITCTTNLGHTYSSYNPEDFYIKINKEPEPSYLWVLYDDPTSVSLSFMNSGGTNNLINYGGSSSPPYNGDDLNEGSSPIDITNNTSFDLSGFNACSDYYLTGEAVNSEGNSSYWNEERLLLFEAEDQQPVTYLQTDVIMSEDYTFSGNYIFSNDLIIENGAEITLDGGYYYFYENSNVIIKQGGKLIVDNATCKGPCGNQWKGIQAWGTRDASQMPCASGSNCQQGFVELINGAVIENAEIAVDLWKPGNYSMTGGIVQATDAIFRNNAKSIHAAHYKNFNPYDPDSSEVENMSYFSNCTFEITADYAGPAKFVKHVDLARVSGIHFRGCDFSLDHQATHIDEYTHAIAAYTAGFWVEDRCLNSTVPCDDMDKCTFTGFYDAVSSSSQDLDNNYPFTVKNAEFHNNAYGVTATNVNYATVLFNEFYVGPNNSKDKDCCSTAPGTGVWIDESSGFAIEENYFTKAPDAPSGNYIGIHIKGTHSADEIYKNTFEGLSYGNFAEGINWGSDIDQGAEYLCNNNTQNWADFYVAEIDYDGIQSKQGNQNLAAGNKFSPTGAEWHFYNGGDYQIDYYYCNQSSCTDEEPLYVNNDVNPIPTNESHQCLSHYDDDTRKVSLTSEQKAEAEQDYYENYTAYNDVKSLYDNLTDGGNTEAEIQDVETAQPSDMWELRSQLLGDSPHLSMEVLKKTADRTDVFSDQALFDILSANPDELRKEELIKYLEEKDDPLPDYMIEILEQVASGITYKTVLRSQLAEHNRKKTRAANDIIRSILNEDNPDLEELRNWLDNLGGIAADRHIISTYMQEGNFDDALSLANMLPGLYDLEGEELTEHNHYMSMIDLYKTLEEDSRNTFQLTDQEIADLEYIAENSNGNASAQARSILESAYGYHFYSCPEMLGDEGYKSEGINSDNVAKLMGVSITVNPNPANQWAAFDYTLPSENSTGVLTLINARGETVKTFRLKGKQGQKLVDTRAMKPGAYLYKLNAEGALKTGKLIITN